MKRKDLVFITFILLLFIPFFISDKLYSVYSAFNSAHGFVTSFIKFAILATSGELLGLRIRSGNYFAVGFGILPRALIWGFYGILIKSAFIIFSGGVPLILSYLGMNEPSAVLLSSFSVSKLLVAFSISLFLNMFFSPLLMTLHKITDTHIQTCQGKLTSLITTINVGDILGKIDWRMHWGFILKKSIPLFWLPAHTITFLLPADMQILFAAILGIVLGIILAMASVSGTDK
jgi:hypothetical protein